MSADLRERLDAMADARISALETQARRDAAVALIEEHGHASREDVEARLAETFRKPTRAELADQLARKAAAGMEHANAVAMSARAENDRAREVRDKLTAHLADAEQAVADADRAVIFADRAVDEAEELAEYAARFGDPGQDAPGRAVEAPAEPVEITEG